MKYADATQEAVHCEYRKCGDQKVETGLYKRI